MTADPEATRRLAARMVHRALDRGAMPDVAYISAATSLTMAEIRAIIAAESAQRGASESPPPPAPPFPPDPAAEGGGSNPRALVPPEYAHPFIGGMSYAVETLRHNLLAQVNAHADTHGTDCVACRARTLAAAEAAVWLDRELDAWGRWSAGT